MKHAYLIIFHNEFEVTQRLLQAIDDVRNDIFIHVDKKVENIPDFSVLRSQLHIIEDRVDVRWGDISVVRAELALMSSALNSGKYSIMHLLSGVDIPLQSQDYIHNFFAANFNKEFIGFSQYDYEREINRKVRMFHLFPKYFRFDGSLIGLIQKLVRFLFIRVQLILRFRRNKKIKFKKGTQWASITPNFAKLILSKVEEIEHIYANTFCADEIYKQTICWNSEFRQNVYNISDEGVGCMRMIGWENGELKDWENKDVDKLISSNMIFARKFNSKNIKVVDELLKRICNYD